ncbi:MAG: lipocalin-like domain-containing protein [Pseudomonadota bacterium]
MLRLFCVLLAAGLVHSASAQEASRLAELLGSGDRAFPRVTTAREFDFPADHGPHPEYRNEWWYVTGNLDDPGGRRFGFELTIFRFALAPTPPRSDSAWRSNQVYIAHLALTDPDGERFLTAEKVSRGAAGLAGAAAEPFSVWVDDWRIEAQTDNPDIWRLTAASDEFSLALELRSAKPPVLNGDAGLSRKSDEAGNASYYYSMTRLETAGEIRLDGRVFSVSGASWLDREWSSSALAADQIGWDWFALQLDNNYELMFYSLRRRDGSQDPNSSGTLTAADGSAVKLGADALRLDVLDTWDSPAGGTYPARWRIEVPDEALELEIVPVLANQELFTTVRYWEGAVDVRGTARGRPVSGRGYVELTGYAEDENPQ